MIKSNTCTLEPKWLTSKEAKAKLKITSCELMHRRVEGKLQYKKVGNSYFYLV